MSLRRCMAEIDSAEFAEWIAYYQVEPFGEERADLRAGIGAAVVANVNRGAGAKAFSAVDFMPQFGGKRSDEQTPEQMMAVMLAVDAAQKARRR